MSEGLAEETHYFQVDPSPPVLSGHWERLAPASKEALVVVQPRLDVPPEILEGLASGMYKLFGGTVRDAAAGYIVKHLKDAPSPVAQPIVAAVEGASTRATQAFKNPWVIGATLLGTIVLTATAAAIINSRTKPKEKPESIEVPAYITKYNEALREYLEAARGGTLDAFAVTTLIDALDEVAKDGVVDSANEESARLVSLLVGYTRALADANSVSLEELLSPVADDDLAGDLRRHLVAQLSIFSMSE